MLYTDKRDPAVNWWSYRLTIVFNIISLNSAVLISVRSFPRDIYPSTRHLSIHPRDIYSSIHATFIHPSMRHLFIHPRDIYSSIHATLIHPSTRHLFIHPRDTYSSIHATLIHPSTRHLFIHPRDTYSSIHATFIHPSTRHLFIHPRDMCISRVGSRFFCLATLHTTNTLLGVNPDNKLLQRTRTRTRTRTPVRRHPRAGT